MASKSVADDIATGNEEKIQKAEAKETQEGEVKNRKDMIKKEDAFMEGGETEKIEKSDVEETKEDLLEISKDMVNKEDTFMEDGNEEKDAQPQMEDFTFDADSSRSSNDMADQEEVEGEIDEPLNVCRTDEMNSTRSTCDSLLSTMTTDSEIEAFIETINHDNRYDWMTVGLKTGIATCVHPSQMTQILIQAGYEPFPPRPSVTLLGRPCLLLPSTGSYLKYIYQVDGIRGIFRGLCPRLAYQLLFTYVTRTTSRFFRRRHITTMLARARTHAAMEIAAAGDNPVAILTSDQRQDGENEEGIVGLFDHVREFFHDILAKVAAVVAAYPLQVIAVRTIAQFVGRDKTIGRGVFGEIMAIYKDFGILGFYRGIVPKIIGETCQTLMLGVLTYFVNNGVPGFEIRTLLNFSFSILVSAWTYRFNVVSTTMIVNGSSLPLGLPPNQPLYANWLQCWNDLSRYNMLNRGSSVFCRYYTGPTMLINGIREPSAMYFGPNYLPVLHLSQDGAFFSELVLASSFLYIFMWKDSWFQGF